MSWASELPQELLCRPMGLIVLTGVDLIYNAVHKAIWDSFCNNRRNDRVPLQFKVLGADHEYPKCRSKRTSYEWYIPKGILKSSWMKKQLDEIPSVVVMFFDLDWDELLWKERQMECSTRVEIVRNSLLGRGTKVCVVLIQKNAPLPPGEDVVAAERAASFCSACDLSAKSLFVLPLTDHLQGYVIRLENAFYELAQSYYHTEGRKVKAHKEFLNKTTHQLLYVRHQFKIAFYNELKQDTHTALKHYKQAYGHILELRMHDSNLLEVKSSAGFINYKICRLSFQHNAPLDAIAQFRKHIDFFKNKVGIAELAFEHSAWMSKQFQVFGDLFDEAIKLGLTAIQTQHPGFYYQQAGNHAAARKQLARQLCQTTAAPTPDPLESLNCLDYYSQRPWRQGHQSLDPPDALKERDGIQALQALECKVDHSWIIVPLLSSAVAQFKKYKSPRMKRYLMVQMGEEYYNAKDYAKALSLVSRVTWEYRQERWWPLLTSILATALRCAYLTASVQEYVTTCFEMMGKYTICSQEEKTRVQMNLIRAISNSPPEPELGLDAEAVEEAHGLWKVDLQTAEPCIFTVEMHNIVAFVECKACFIQESFMADETIVLRVFLRTSCPFPIRFSKLCVLLSNQVYNQYCVINDTSQSPPAPEGEEPVSEESDAGSAGDLYLVPGQVKTHTFSFTAQREDIGKILEITSVALELGTESTRCAIMHWSGGGGDTVVPPISQHMHYKRGVERQGIVAADTPWELVQVNSVTRLMARAANMSISIEHEPPALVNEFYLLRVCVVNEETVPITNIQLSFGLKEGQSAETEQSTHVSVHEPEASEKVVSRRGGVELSSLDPQQQTEKLFYMKCEGLGERGVYARVSYNVEVTGADGQQLVCNCHKEETVTLPTVNPFDITLRLVSMQYNKLETVHVEEPFLLLADVHCCSPWPIDIHTSTLNLSPYVKHTDEEVEESALTNVELRSGDCASECWSLVAPLSIQPNVLLGSYTVIWKRQTSAEKVPTVSSVTALPTICVEHVPLFVDMDIPAHGNVRQALPVTYRVYNRTPYSQEVDLNMDPSDAFMFAGHKQVHLRILPNSKYQLSYNLVPLLPGNVLLPQLHINMLRYPGTMDDIVQKMLPSHVFVLPCGRTNNQEMTELIESEA